MKAIGLNIEDSAIKFIDFIDLIKDGTISPTYLQKL